MMKVAWFTPFDESSAIGRYSMHATAALSRVCDVDLFVERFPRMHPTGLKQVFFQEESPSALAAALAGYDHIVYNLGNHAYYHGAIYDVLKDHPGVVIAHDVSMFHLCHDYYYDKNQCETFNAVAEQLYGQGGVRAAFSMDHAITRQRVDFLKYDFAQWACKNATGVIVHSEYHKSVWQKSYSGPIAVLPLVKMRDYGEPGQKDGFSGYGQGKTNLLSVGYVNRNKLVDKVMEAIAASKYLRDNVCYAIVGDTPDGHYLQQLLHTMKTKKLDGCVKIMGRVDEAALQQYYDNADIICNLRLPAIEGASATLQEQLYQGKTTVVADTGTYGDTPDDCVVKIDPANLVPSLIAQLEKLARDTAYRQSFGEKARAYAQEAYAPDTYVERFLDFTGEDGPVAFLKPINYVLQKLDWETRVMGMKTTHGKAPSAALRVVAGEMETLFAAPGQANAGADKPI